MFSIWFITACLCCQGSVAIWVQNRQDFPKGSAHTEDRQINSGCPVKFDSDIDNKQFFSLRPKPCIHCLSETLAFSLLNLSALNVHQCNDRWIMPGMFPCPWVADSRVHLGSGLSSCSSPGKNKPCQAFICECDRNAAICFSKAPYNKEHKNLNTKKFCQD